MQFNQHQRDKRLTSECDEDVEFLRGRVSALELQVAQLEAERNTLDAELDAVRKAVISEKLVTRDYIEALKGQLSELALLRDAYAVLASHTEDTISALQVEGAEIAALIDTVQASHFWKLKRIVRRMRAGAVRR